MNKYFACNSTSIFWPVKPRRKPIALSRIRVEGSLMTLGLILALLGTAYIVLVNMVAAKGFKLRDQRARIEELMLQNKKAETELANRESIARLEEEARRMGLVPIGRVKYVEPVSGAVVRK